MMEKNGMLTDKSQADFGMGKHAEYIDADGFEVADADNRHKLRRPVRFHQPETEQIPSNLN